MTASIWYEERPEGLGIKFEKIIDNKIKQILKNPFVFSENKNSYRQANTEIFPFVIVYKINNHLKQIYISAIHHTSKHPKGKYR